MTEGECLNCVWWYMLIMAALFVIIPPIMVLYNELKNKIKNK